LRFLFFIGDYQVNVELIFRIIGMLILAAFGVYWGIQLATIFELSTLISSIVLGLVGAVIGFIFTPYVTTRPATSIRNVLSRISAQTVVFVMRQDDIINVLKYLPGRSSPSTNQAEGILDEAAAGTILLDTSVIIDGRIADIARTGFLVGSLLIPRFVLNELQYIADSSDSLRRQRGRRGMEVLSQLQKDNVIPVQISDIDVEGIREVDEKLVVLARQLSCSILTNETMGQWWL
jgi:uncharacterized protein YacL